MNTKELVRKTMLGIKKGLERNIESKRLVSDGILDSFDIISLILELEEAFDIEIDPEDVIMENFESVNAIAALVESAAKTE